ncbi:MAG TPA: hypothetical protein RMH99_19340 [Sandaracinaceae bacterium LLY-WYZ-13_1]|nr:hypothetical protein [Sandaracinaceae bacterium LLY-WYZ-13_1]
MSDVDLSVEALLGPDPVLAATCRWVDDPGRPLALTGDEPTLDDPHYTYAVERAGEPFGRVRGRSRILHVGKGTPPRVLGLFGGTHASLPALYRAGRALGLDGTDAPELRVWVKAQPSDAISAVEEARALHRLARTHGELPPCNLRWGGYVLGEYLRLLTRLAGHRGKISVYDWPRRRPYATWADVHEKGRWVWSLAWVWTREWLGEGTEEPPHAGELLLVLPKTAGVAEHRSHRALRTGVLEASRGARVSTSVPLRALATIETDEGTARLFDVLRTLEAPATRDVKSQRAVIEVLAEALGE